jgi:serine/threonine-protein kinase
LIGKTLAHYTVTGLLGRGGMGAVYRARDEKLGRDVALKILPAEFAQNVERLARFQREARTLASLSHPHIASIHGLEEADGERFLVLELVEGEDLSQRMQRGPIPLDEALPIAVQIAEALESAHERGIIHRDLKPANVKLTPDGQIKLLDFGLARAMAGSTEDDEDLEHSPTITAAFTAAGTILGTAAYMSPEQARGRTIDRRADIWAFGAVLFEMLNGRRLFAGETVSDTLASVIKEEPDYEALPGDTPPVISALLRRCLQKDPKRRLQSIGEARIAIQELQQGNEVSLAGSTLLSPGTVAEIRDAPSARRIPLLAWVAALVAVGAIGFLLGTRQDAPESNPRLRKYTLQPKDLSVLYPTQPALSPDGRRIAYFAGTVLRIQDLHTLEPIEVPESDGATAPFWSPDGQWLGFGLHGRIYKVLATGGRPESVCDVDFSPLDGAAWGDDGNMILAPDSGPMQIVSAQGGDPQVLFPLGTGETDYHTPCVLPGGRGIVFTTHSQEGRDTIEVLSEGRRKVLLKIPDARLEYATWSATAPSKNQGHLVYHRLNTNPGIWAVPFDLQSLELTGDPFLVDANGAFPSLGRDGSLLYANTTGQGPMRLVLVDRKGTIVQRLGEPTEGLFGFAISPDGKSILLEREDNGNDDIWLHDIRRQTTTRMTFSPDDEQHPCWLGRGDRIVYTSDNTLWVRPTSGAGEPQLLVDDGYAASSVPASEWIAYVVYQRDTGNDVYCHKIDSTDEPRALVRTPASESGPQISPDGRHLIYMSSETGRNEVYLIPFPTGEGKWQVSTHGGVWPRWNPSGQEIIFRVSSGSTAKMMSVAVETEPTLKLGEPRELFAATDAPSLQYMSGFAAYGVMPGSDLLLMQEQTDYGPARSLKLVFTEDWYASYREKTSR